MMFGYTHTPEHGQGEVLCLWYGGGTSSCVECWLAMYVVQAISHARSAEELCLSSGLLAHWNIFFRQTCFVAYDTLPVAGGSQLSYASGLMGKLVLEHMKWY